MAEVFKSYKYRIYPTQKQKELLSKHFGACRFVYNLALETKQYAWGWHKHKVGEYDLIRQLTELKKDLTWLREVSNHSLQQAILDMGSAYKMFFNRQNKRPLFKKRHGRQSYRVMENIRPVFGRGVIKLPKMQEGIKCVFDREFKGIIKSATVSKTTTGKYYVSVLVKNSLNPIDKEEVKEECSIGVDLGLKSFAVTSTGEVIDNPNFLKNDIQRLRVLSKRVSRKVDGSRNKEKAIKKLGLRYEKITNKKSDFLHKLSRRLIDENQGGTICLENLNIKGLVKNRKLSRSIHYVGWGEFVRQLKYKGDWYGVNILQINRFAPSSKACSCGYLNKGLTLSEREWSCPECGAKHDRDLLAANNIKKFALREYSGQGMPSEPVEASTLVESVKQEELINYNLNTVFHG